MALQMNPSLWNNMLAKNNAAQIGRAVQQAPVNFTGHAIPAQRPQVVTQAAPGAYQPGKAQDRQFRGGRPGAGNWAQIGQKPPVAPMQGTGTGGGGRTPGPRPTGVGPSDIPTQEFLPNNPLNKYGIDQVVGAGPSGAIDGMATSGYQKQLGPAGGGMSVLRPAPMQVYDPNAGRQQGQNTRQEQSPFESGPDVSGFLKSFDSPVEEINTARDNYVDAFPKYGQENPGHYLDRLRNGFNKGATDSGLPPSPASLSPQDMATWFFELAKQGIGSAVGTAGDASRDIANKMNEGNLVSTNKQFNNFADLDPNKKFGEELLNPATRAAANQAEQEQMRGEIDRQRDAQLRSLGAAQNAGGRMGSGSTQGAYSGAEQAAGQGSLKLAQDQYNRMLQGGQLGSSVLSDRAKTVYDLINQGRTMPKEIMAILAEMIPEMFGSTMDLGGDVASALAESAYPG